MRNRPERLAQEYLKELGDKEADYLLNPIDAFVQHHKELEQLGIIEDKAVYKYMDLVGQHHVDEEANEHLPDEVYNLKDSWVSITNN